MFFCKNRTAHRLWPDCLSRNRNHRNFCRCPAALPSGHRQLDTHHAVSAVVYCPLYFTAYPFSNDPVYRRHRILLLLSCDKYHRTDHGLYYDHKSHGLTFLGGLSYRRIPDSVRNRSYRTGCLRTAGIVSGNILLEENKTTTG